MIRDRCAKSIENNLLTFYALAAIGKAKTSDLASGPPSEKQVAMPVLGKNTFGDFEEGIRRRRDQQQHPVAFRLIERRDVLALTWFLSSPIAICMPVIGAFDHEVELIRIVVRWRAERVAIQRRRNGL